jgi:hypothetical protein
MTLEQMKSLKAALDEKKAELDVIVEESNENVAAQQSLADSEETGSVLTLPMGSVPMAVMSLQPPPPQPLLQDVPSQVITEEQLMVPTPEQQMGGMMGNWMGGMMVPGGAPTYITPPPTNSSVGVGNQGGPIIVVDTGGARMQQELGGMGGFSRAPRRNPFRRNMFGGGMDFDMGSSTSGPNEGGNNGSSSSVNVRVNKME